MVVYYDTSSYRYSNAHQQRIMSILTGVSASPFSLVSVLIILFVCTKIILISNLFQCVGLFVVLKMGAITDDSACTYEKSLIQEFVEQAR